MSIRFRQANAWLRILPDFIILGVPKAGTTSLFSYLTENPSILSPLTKEVLFFERHYGKGTYWYRSFFPTRFAIAAKNIVGQPSVTGEASPYYFQHPLVPGRIKQLLPNAKLIVLLRNPIDRAWSHFRHNVSHSRESLSFEDALAAEPERIAKGMRMLRLDEYCFPSDMLHYSYLETGCYATHLKRWLTHFSLEQLLVIAAEDLFQSTEDTVEQALKYLDIKPVIGQSYPAKNIGQIKSKMPEEMRRRLQKHFESPNRELSELLQVDFVSRWR